MENAEIDPSLLEQFQAVTNADFAMAHFLLEASGGDFDLALNTFFEQQQVAAASSLDQIPPSATIRYNNSSNHEDRSASVLRALQGAVVPPRPLAPLHPTPAGPTSSSFGANPSTNNAAADMQANNNPSGIRGGGRGGRGGRGGLIRVLGRVMGLPWILIRVAVSSLWVVSSLSLSLITILGNRLIPPRALRAARRVVTSLQGSGAAQDNDPSAQARSFAQQFASSYLRSNQNSGASTAAASAASSSAAAANEGPRFVEVGARQAMQLARSQHKFTFVYLHAPEHEESDSFCTKVLCDPALSAFINQQFVAWGGNIHNPDAHQLSQRLGVTGYPCVSLLSMTPDSRVHLVGIYYPTHQEPRPMTPHDLLVHLSRAVDRHGGALVAHRMEQEEREMARRLREEQDADYERSLQADREREARKREEVERARREEREREEEEARVRAEEEAVRRRTREREETIERRRQEAKASLVNQEEDRANTAKDVALVRIRLPDGSNSQRKFDPLDELQRLFDFVDSLDQTSYLSYTLISSFPRRTFTRQEASLTLEEAGLTPQAALFVQPIDDD